MKTKLEIEQKEYRALTKSSDNWASRELSQSKFPTAAAVWRNPAKALVPTDHAGQYQTVLALCQLVGPESKRHEALIAYASRLYRPVGAFCIYRLFSHYSRTIPNHASFRSWFVRNQDLFN